MTKLNGTSGQLFSVIAESINARSTARSGKSSGAQVTADRSFRDLLHTVSNPPKRASGDQGQEAPVKPGALHARVEPLAQRAGRGDETLLEREEKAEEPDASHQPAAPDHAVSTAVDVQSRLVLPSVIAQAVAAVPALKSPVQQSADDKGAAPARTERSSTTGEPAGRSAASTIKADAADAGSRPSVAAPQATPAAQANASAAKTTPAAPGFEAVTATVERAVKVSARETLPEATKVTVVQQETHLPPVPQFTAGQQVATAVVAELEGSAAPPASAAPDPASPQSGAPDQPLKILTISLEPPALGNVTVRLRLVGAAVSVHLAADRRDTSQMLDQQRDSIRELMQSAGYVAEVAPVHHGALDGFQAGSGQSHQSFSGHQSSSPQAQGTLDGSATSSGQSQGGAKQARQEQQPNQETRHEQDVAPHHRRGAVYL